MLEHIHESIVYGILAISLYFEVFLLLTYFEKRTKIQQEETVAFRGVWPSVTVIVPCFNEERTVSKTIASLIALDYPKDRLRIIAVNDGSTDTTALVLKELKKSHGIEIISKENGGKHTALNLAIKGVTSDFLACLDADSYVETDALKKLIARFLDPSVMAVVPSLHIYEPKTIIQRIQAIEYRFSVFLRKIFAELDALYVTPGPFSVFRKEVFETLGLYRKAHNTEDLEMALRMQAAHLKIANAHDARVHTSSPRTIRSLYKQRVRWTSGFIKNAFDYRRLLFKPAYGTFGMIVMPFAFLSIISVVYIFGSVLFEGILRISRIFEQIQIIGFEWSMPSFNWFFIDTELFVTAGFVALLLGVIFLFLGTRLGAVKEFGFRNLMYYLLFYHLIVPFWIIGACSNILFARTIPWR